MGSICFKGPQLSVGGEENFSLLRGLALTLSFSWMRAEELAQAVLEVGTT